SGLVEALKTPSSNLPLAKAQGAVLVSTGPRPFGASQVAQAYDTLYSLTGRRLSFAHGSVVSATEPRLCLLLTGYDYSSSIGSFVDLLTELYDVELGQPAGNLDKPLRLPIYQLERTLS
ncbi:MAG TPA: hypothetical protein VE177_07660, partial [Candidatus Binatus sp.]|nr:hypothetical protein [Candidatus Binatus sp.]